ncbi:MAG: hypothetical protein ACFCVK_07855 [Acidimicrobiales bacterium]
MSVSSDAVRNGCRVLAGPGFALVRPQAQRRIMERITIAGERPY